MIPECKEHSILKALKENEKKHTQTHTLAICLHNAKLRMK